MRWRTSSAVSNSGGFILVQVDPFKGPVLAALLGAIAGAGAWFAVDRLAPEIYAGHVLFVTSGSSDDLVARADRWQQRMTRWVGNPDELSQLVARGAISLEVATEIGGSLEVKPTTKGGAVFELYGTAHRDDVLRSGLDQLAEALLASQVKRRAAAVDARLAEIDAWRVRLDEKARLARAEQSASQLPTGARSSVLTLGRLDGELFELSLKRQLGLALSPDELEREKVLIERIDALTALAAASSPVDPQHFEAARTLAAVEWQRSHLLRAQRAAETDLLAPAPLKVLQSARVTAADAGRPLPVYAVAGAALGFLLLGWPSARLSVRRPPVDGPTLEANVSVRVIGALPAVFSDKAREHGVPLASREPDHLALHSVRSLWTALRLVGERARRGPLLFVDIDGAAHAGHAVANLAVLLADQGQRVLVVEAGDAASVLHHVFTSGTDVAQADGKRKGEDTGEGEAADRGQRHGRIRFAQADAAGEATPPVPGAFTSYFDHILVRADNVATAASIAGHYDGCQCVLVGDQTLSFRQWRAARSAWRRHGVDTMMIGLLVGGVPLNRSDYAGSD